jgi:hypothetical protein
LFDFIDDFRQLFIAAEYDVFLGKSEVKFMVPKVLIRRGTYIIVTATGAGILSAAYRSVRNMDHIFDRTPHHPFRTGVSATTNGHHTGQRFTVGSNTFVGFFLFVIVDGQMFGTVFFAFSG